MLLKMQSLDKMIVELTDGIEITSRIEAGEIVEHVSHRVLGRVALEEVVNADGKVLFPKNHMFVEADCEQSSLKMSI